MNYMAVLAGTAIALALIGLFGQMTDSNKGRAYTWILLSLPVFYWGFAAVAGAVNVLVYEILAALVFIIMAFVAMEYHFRVLVIMLGAAFLIHGIYDLVHDGLFINPGRPPWWPEFCLVVDLILGCYLLLLAIRPPAAETEETSGQ